LVVTKPAASQFQAQNDMERVRILYLRSSKYMFMLSWPAVFFLFFFHDNILMTWLGREDFIRVSYLVPILAVIHVGWLNLKTNYYIINGIGRHRAFAIIAVATTITSVILAVLFVKVANADLLGVAVGMGLPVIIVSFFIIPIYSCRVLCVNGVDYIKQCVLRLIVPLFIFVSILLVWKMIVVEMVLSQLLLCMACSVFVLGVSYWFLSLSKQERRVFSGIFNNIFRLSTGGSDN